MKTGKWALEKCMHCVYRSQERVQIAPPQASVHHRRAPRVQSDQHLFGGEERR